MGGRRAYRYARACASVWSGAARRARRRLDGSSAAVLMYHRVLPRSEADRLAVEPGMFVAPDTFGRHLDWLVAAFRVLPLHEIVSRLVGERSLPPGACAITFDDGWRDNHDHALPELERRGLPATIFVVTERVGTAGAFWPDEVCRRMAGLAVVEQRALVASLGLLVSGNPVWGLLDHLKACAPGEREAFLDALRSSSSEPDAGERELLDWSELDRLARGGFDVESHGATHAILTKVPPDDAEGELRSALEQLRERGHGRHRLLAYPSGANDPSLRRLARTVGYAAAFTTAPGPAKSTDDPFGLPRLSLHDDVSRTRVEFLQRVPGRS